MPGFKNLVIKGAAFGQFHKQVEDYFSERWSTIVTERNGDLVAHDLSHEEIEQAKEDLHTMKQSSGVSYGNERVWCDECGGYWLPHEH